MLKKIQYMLKFVEVQNAFKKFPDADEFNMAQKVAEFADLDGLYQAKVDALTRSIHDMVFADDGAGEGTAAAVEAGWSVRNVVDAPVVKLTELLSDKGVLDEIAEILSGNEWEAETLDRVADLVRLSGRAIVDSAVPSAVAADA